MMNHTIKYESSKDAEVSPDLSMYFITEGIKSHRATEHEKKKSSQLVDTAWPLIIFYSQIHKELILLALDIHSNITT